MEEETKLETPEEKTHRKERERFMRQAITQAKKAEKLMEVPIGCVIVYEGKVIARGYNRRNTDKNTLSHAELNAIRKASKKLGGWRAVRCMSPWNRARCAPVRSYRRESAKSSSAA